MTAYRYTGAQSGTYRMGCESAAMCKKQDEYASYFSKRGLETTSEETALDSNESQASNKSKRYIDDPLVICLSCCKYPFCNNHENCVTNEKAPPPRTTTMP
ncbi:hypothetical protein EGW08_015694 [Elysia chlorotica]|uniref:Uncharacterized protein n=1 Tax=Elysia chlorotica TaxID=188477 RepID=A0A3S1BWB3_ELYCH|nr:hypothetical protein EGW08_015694 [Elysia chlorotica]